MLAKVYKSLQLFIAFLSLVPNMTNSSPPNNWAEEKLMKDLLANYNPLTRPRSWLTVAFAMRLREIVEIDEKNQLMSLGFQLDHGWTEDRLKWNKSKYANVETLLIPAKKLWIPDIYIQNIVTSNGFLFNMDGLTISVFHEGWCHISIPVYSVKTTCALNFENFPFDEQICSVIFQSWSQASHRLNFYSAFAKMLFHKAYIPNPKWNLSNSSIKIFPFATTNSNEGWSFFAFRYDLYLSRNSQNFMTNTIMPFYIINAITFTGFLLPYSQQIIFCK